MWMWNGQVTVLEFFICIKYDVDIQRSWRVFKGSDPLETLLCIETKME